MYIGLLWSVGAYMRSNTNPASQTLARHDLLFDAVWAYVSTGPLLHLDPQAGLRGALNSRKAQTLQIWRLRPGYVSPKLERYGEPSVCIGHHTACPHPDSPKRPQSMLQLGLGFRVQLKKAHPQYPYAMGKAGKSVTTWPCEAALRWMRHRVGPLRLPTPTFSVFILEFLKVSIC